MHSKLGLHMRRSEILCSSEQSLEKQRPGNPHDLAARALAMLASIEPGHVQPQQVTVLAAGTLLLCSWRFLSDRLSAFETQGIASLSDVWILIAAALGVGQAARWAFRKAMGRGWIGSSWKPSASEVNEAAASQECFPAPAVLCKEGFEDSRDQSPAAGMREDEDDVGAQKRRAQAEAAAQRAEYRSQLQLVLSSMGKSGKVDDDAQLLYRLADQLFASPLNVVELIEQGGVSVLHKAADRALQELRREHCDSAALTLLLQVSWIFLQVAHGPPSCRASIHSKEVVLLLLDAVQAVMATAAAPAGLLESILRNLCWCLFVLCDNASMTTSSSSSSSSSSSVMPVLSSCAGSAGDGSAATYVLMLHSAGVVGLLQQLLSLQHGPAPGWVAAATLGFFLQVGGKHLQQPQQRQALHKQQQQQLHALKAASADVVTAVLQPSSLHGLGALLHHRPQLSGRLQGLVMGQLHYLIAMKPTELLEALIEEHLVGCFASGMVKKLGRLLVCQLLSSQGQDVMAKIEQQYELDVALALAQVVPLPVHLKLSTHPVQAQQHQLVEGQLGRGGQIELADDGEDDDDDLHAVDQHVPAPRTAQQVPATAALAVVDDVYTDILACRLLLQHSRLDELLAAFWDEMENQGQAAGAHAAADAGAGCTCCEQDLPPVCAAVLALVRHLMSRDLSLQAVPPHMRGDSIDESLSSTSSNSCIDVALSMPDVSGVYSAVLSGMVLPQDLPASRSGCCSLGSEAAAGGLGSAHQHQQASQLLVLPQLPADGAAGAPPPGPQQMPAESGNSSNLRMVVFRFGHLEHSVTQQMYTQVRQSSKLMHSMLRKAPLSQDCPVTVLVTPHFTQEANCWVLQCLERWLSTGELWGFSAAQACKLWIAADFLQVEELQAACEDVMAATFAADGQWYEVATALELCVRHTNSSIRLQRLVAQGLMRGCSTSEVEQHRPALLQLRSLMGRYKEVLLPAMREEIRDRLVTLCMLNAGVDDDMLEEVVE